MVYCLPTTRMLVSIRDILLINSPQDSPRFRAPLGDGHQWSMDIPCFVQPSPDGLPQAFILGRTYVGGRPSALVQGGNMLCGHDFPCLPQCAAVHTRGATVSAYHLHDTQRYSVVDFDARKRALSVEGKLTAPKGNYAMTGLYCHDAQVCDIAVWIRSSARGVLKNAEAPVHRLWQQFVVKIVDRDYAWWDTGAHDSLLGTWQFMFTLEKCRSLEVA